MVDERWLRSRHAGGATTYAGPHDVERELLPLLAPLGIT
jgi:hypothetical protein